MLVVDAGVDAGRLSFAFEADFGAVLRGDAVEHVGTFTNTTARPITVSDLVVAGPHFTRVDSPTLTVPASGEATLRVRYAPTTFGVHQATLSFTSEGAPFDLAPLRGTAIGPSLALTPSRLDLGTLELYAGVPATAAATLTAKNVGGNTTPPRADAELQLFFEVLSAGGAATDALCVGDCTSTPLRLAAGDTLAVPVTLTSTTPGLKTWNVRGFSNDPTAPMLSVLVKAEVIARPTCRFALPAALRFGLLTAPERRDLELRFENVGTEVCEVGPIELGPEPMFSLVSAPTGTQLLAPGDALRLTVRASAQGAPPAVPLHVVSELLIPVNQPGGPARVALSADLGLSCLLVAPSPIDFGTVKTGCRSADRAMALFNRCSTAVTVTSATLPGFSVFSLAATLPRTLLANESVSLTTRYAPVTVGGDRDVVTLAWMDGTTARHTTVVLQGEANLTAQNTEQFSPATNKLDLLLVLDDSASMLDKQARVAAQLPGLIAALQFRNVDFHVGVIDAVAQGGGRLRRTSAGLRWVTPSTPGLGLRFAELIASTGLGDPEAFQAPALAALTPPFVGDPLINAGFLRNDAALEVIVVTDADDGEDRLLQLQQLKGPGGRFTWDVIGPFGAPNAPGCQTTPATHDLLIIATGGARQDVCANDWSPFFVTVASRAGDVRTFFPLRARPDPLGTPALTVDFSGQVVPSTAWTWESVPNAVRFEPLYAPAPGTSVTITYPVACAP